MLAFGICCSDLLRMVYPDVKIVRALLGAGVCLCISGGHPSGDQKALGMLDCLGRSLPRRVGRSWQHTFRKGATMLFQVPLSPYSLACTLPG